jgi:opacity protein-like surface antigen
MLKQLMKMICVVTVLIPASSAFARLIFLDDVPYTSGFYTGIQGGYVLAKDTAKYRGTTFPNKEKDRNLNAFGGGVFAGYGHVIAHGNLPYIGGEIGAHYRSNYNSGLYGARINAPWYISADVMPGFFLDEKETTLVYFRLGVEGEQFKLSGSGLSGHKNKIVYRAGAGIEHQLVDRFYVRLDYVFASPAGRITFNESFGTYSSNVYFNTFTVGLNYRF